MRVDARHALYLSLLGRLLLRPRPAVWANFLRYKMSISRVRRNGPDSLTFTPPDVVVWITARCNKACAFCHYTGELNADAQGAMELSLDRFVEVLEHPLIRHAIRICLYGGEPLLNRDVFQMVRIAKRRGHLVTVNTNGLLLLRRGDELQVDPPDMLSVSCYPEDRACLADALSRVPPRTAVKLVFLLSRTRLTQVPHVLELSASRGIRTVCFEHVCAHGRGDGVPLPDTDADLIALKTAMTARFGRRVRMVWPNSQPGPETRCRYFWSTAVVDAGGRLSPCCVWPMRKFEGDIFSDPDAWNDDRMRTVRKMMRDDRPPKECAQCPYLRDDPLAL